ncbi:OB-fold putative lipoprotein [Acidithiobacillus sulfurivorans]|uniref:tRNA_anti-like n=1 Tax=Acidithiobacillus sulfurivorans TaxID=1958756 RepID=A0ABS6A2D6_9PROT|nr:OB-fold putative lipoprotein [Acidithiobacillus sulfurivorans]MBU2761669.1 hypothetical protein [Acidithiobacillus sulfurivorans]
MSRKLNAACLNSILMMGFLAASPTAFAGANTGKTDQITPNQIFHNLSMESSVQRCTPEVNLHFVKDALNYYKMGNYVLAKEDSSIAAEGISYCIDHGMTNASSAGSSVGLLLAMDALSSSHTGLLMPQTYTIANYAKILLEDYPDKSSSKDIELMKSAGFFGSPMPPKTSAISALSLSAVDIVGQYNSNSFAFKKKYNDKTIIVSGVLSNITSAPNGGASIGIDGAPNVNINDRGFNDYVYCQVSKANVSEVMNLSKGKTVTIKGVFDPKLANKLDDGITLEPINLFSCSVVK